MSAAALHAVTFENAPPVGLQQRLGLIKPGRARVGTRALAVAIVAWLPLVALASMQGVDSLTSLGDVSLHARYLIATPLLVIAEAVCAPKLNGVVSQFVEEGIISEEASGQFDAAVISTQRLLQSGVAEAVVVGLAYVVAAVAIVLLPTVQLPVWHRLAGAADFSPAGWWHMLVSVPLLLVLLFGWLWRLLLWARLLFSISRLPLKLVAAHPDHAAGLGFTGHSLGAFGIVMFAIAAMVAGRTAHFVLAGDAVPLQHIYFAIGFGAFVMALFIVPLFVFVPTLVRAKRTGARGYNGLAVHVGTMFERKWLEGGSKRFASMLDQPDFSATTDLYSIVSNVHAMRPLPINAKDLVLPIVAMALPFLPVVLLTVPPEVILKGLKGLLF